VKLFVVSTTPTASERTTVRAAAREASAESEGARYQNTPKIGSSSGGVEGEPNQVILALCAPRSPPVLRAWPPQLQPAKVAEPLASGERRREGGGEEKERAREIDFRECHDQVFTATHFL